MCPRGARQCRARLRGRWCSTFTYCGLRGRGRRICRPAKERCWSCWRPDIFTRKSGTSWESGWRRCGRTSRISARRCTSAADWRRSPSIGCEGEVRQQGELNVESPWGLDVGAEHNGGSMAGLAVERAGPARVLEATFHVREAAAGAVGSGGQTAAIILNADSEGGLFPIDVNREFGSFGVFDHVVHGFFDGHDEIVADRAGNLDAVRQIGIVDFGGPGEPKAEGFVPFEQEPLAGRDG